MQFSEKSPAKIRFSGIDIVELNFAAKRPFDENTVIDLDVKPQVFYPQDEPTSFRLLMNVKLHSEGFFTLNLRAIGHFDFSEELDLDSRKIMVDRNATAIMYPYVRAALATISSSFGQSLGTLHIPARFFAGEVPELEVQSMQGESTDITPKRLANPEA